MNGKKIILLSLALLLPVGIFLFLKFFGKNKFDVPPLHQDIVSVSDHCSLTYHAPYLLPDSIMKVIRANSKATLSIVNFSINNSVSQRAGEEFNVSDVHIVEAAVPSAAQINTLFIKDCVLLLKPPFDIVLIDNEKRIRGYYDGNDREEIDRLLVELSIILNKY